MGSRRKATRRQFLKGEAALDALQNVQFGQSADDAESSRPSSVQRTENRANVLLQVGRRAMACQFQVFCDPSRDPGAVEAATESLDLVDQLEGQMTVYREQSEIMSINRTAERGPVRVETRLAGLLHQCLAWSQESNGAFDITASPLVKLWGFYTRRGRFPDTAEIDSTLQQVGSRHVELDLAKSTIHFKRSGIELNLGSVGKGYALDRCAEVLDNENISSFMIHGGQSSILARGVRRAMPGDQQDLAWTVALKHPLRPDRRLVELELRDRALGTSGSGQQFFYHRGRRYGHVLDPRSGMPAEGVLSATVLAPSAAQADALATMFFVLGVDDTAKYCENHPELSVVFVLPGSRQGSVAIEAIRADDVIKE